MSNASNPANMTVGWSCRPASINPRPRSFIPSANLPNANDSANRVKTCLMPSCQMQHYWSRRGDSSLVWTHAAGYKLQMNEWNIQSRAHGCQACQRPFEDKQPYHTLLSDEKQEFHRLDVCEACWKDQ